MMESNDRLESDAMIEISNKLNWKNITIDYDHGYKDKEMICQFVRDWNKTNGYPRLGCVSVLEWNGKHFEEVYLLQKFWKTTPGISE